MDVGLQEAFVQVDIVLSPSSAYYVDILHSQSAQTIAASGYVLYNISLRARRLITLDNTRALRAATIACVTAFILPMINTIGVAATDAIFAGVAWLGSG